MTTITYGFIVAACLRNESHTTSLKNCIESIKLKEESPKIVVVMDFTSSKVYVDQIVSTYPDVIFELETRHVPADMLLLHYFKEKKYFDVAITLQDSMRLKKKLPIPTNPEIDYLWYFTNHRVHWSIIEEPRTEFNISKGIKTHDDLNHYIIDNVLESSEFRKYCQVTYNNKEHWSGCFGCCCIISYEFLEKLDEKTKLINLMYNMTSNRLRRSIESLFSLACQFTKGCEIRSAIDGLYYDGFTGNNLEGEYVMKQSFDRQ
jgi:hypothetical protein